MAHSFLRHLTLLSALTLLSSCTGVGEGQRPVDQPLNVCGFDYTPVCARSGNYVGTFNNACLARNAGFRTVHQGQCRAGQPSLPPACTSVRAPVCAMRNGQSHSFDNPCLAQWSGYIVTGIGACR
jgi:hypothetical protein